MPSAVARMLRRNASSFDPLSLSPALWLKPETLSALSDGATVNPWPDSSGNGHNAAGSASPLISPPTFKKAIQNGRDVVRFTTNQALLIPGYLPANTQASAHTAFLAGAVVSSSNGNFLDTRGSGAAGWIWRASGTTSVVYIWIGSTTQSDTVATNAWHVLEYVRDASKNVQTGHDGALNAAATFTTFTPSADVGLFIMKAMASGAFVSGDVGEILLFDYALNATQRGQVEAYLKTRWATP